MLLIAVPDEAGDILPRGVEGMLPCSLLDIDIVLRASKL